MINKLPRSGYTLPVFACASAIAALSHLQDKDIKNIVSVDLIEPSQVVNIPIEQVAKIGLNSALAITRSDPGDNLDLTRNTPIWVLVELAEQTKANSYKQILVKGGEGIGIQTNNNGEHAIYSYAKKVLQENLKKYLKPTESIIVTIILPEGKKLARRTSNESFGVVKGLSLLGTTGISQPLTAANQLTAYQEELIAKAKQFNSLVFCLGENGLELARKQKINPKIIIKTANWLGPLLVTAGFQKVASLLLFGYHGKLIKLAGGIFHTHHHLADGRLEILVAHGAKIGCPTTKLQQLLKSSTTENGLKLLRDCDEQTGSNWTEKIYQSIAQTIDQKSQAYIRKHADVDVRVGSVLFGRDRSIIVSSNHGKLIMSSEVCK
ncbi:MAG: cobalt-precorrin-5B (C(1))-methyltransferase CbiD [cyanobacterium endosymbiont of Rhopalodia musculus]|uniref:cobalt-precorrin-5B (C(1))-methyltransferase CbiD n=1 Tax=cyanobacterium endosymbiont of Epithemia clementina EcSB TaxID=3034674 RepID=UPI0024800600|nr:cobalt-precorrin-5B (C(1))-methyltransferase CbiD [cyanobacterium endosymbiont of Epithemia clementina EcSB]WGT68018.1 cobalt-precorrin-5B (C(1))-methyltransferase CbiD [cyanobacterium endosymbiont of Epithemia clementina EcSB]